LAVFPGRRRSDVLLDVKNGLPGSTGRAVQILYAERVLAQRLRRPGCPCGDLSQI